MAVKTIEDVRRTCVDDPVVFRMSRDELRQELAELTPLEADSAYALKVACVAGQVQRISLEFLSIRGDDGWPRFAFYRPDSCVCRFTRSVRVSYRFLGKRGHADPSQCVLGWTWNWNHPFGRWNIPGLLLPYCDAMQIDLDRRSLERHSKQQQGSLCWEWEVVARWQGLLPHATRDKLACAQEIELGPLIFVAEVPEWQVNCTKRPVPFVGDPLLIALKTSTNEAYLLDAFDITPVENMVRREFTTD